MKISCLAFAGIICILGYILAMAFVSEGCENNPGYVLTINTSTQAENDENRMKWPWIYKIIGFSGEPSSTQVKLLYGNLPTRMYPVKNCINAHNIVKEALQIFEYTSNRNHYQHSEFRAHVLDSLFDEFLDVLEAAISPWVEMRMLEGELFHCENQLGRMYSLNIPFRVRYGQHFYCEMVFGSSSSTKDLYGLKSHIMSWFSLKTLPFTSPIQDWQAHVQITAYDFVQDCKKAVRSVYLNLHRKSDTVGDEVSLYGQKCYRRTEAKSTVWQILPQVLKPLAVKAQPVSIEE